MKFTIKNHKKQEQEQEQLYCLFCPFTTILNSFMKLDSLIFRTVGFN